MSCLPEERTSRPITPSTDAELDALAPPPMFPQETSIALLTLVCRKPIKPRSIWTSTSDKNSRDTRLKDRQMANAAQVTSHLAVQRICRAAVAPNDSWLQLTSSVEGHSSPTSHGNDRSSQCVWPIARAWFAVLPRRIPRSGLAAQHTSCGLRRVLRADGELRACRSLTLTCPEHCEPWPRVWCRATAARPRALTPPPGFATSLRTAETPLWRFWRRLT